MYNVRIPLHAIEKTVFERITIGVVNDIKTILGIDRKVYTHYEDRSTIKKRTNQLGELKANNNKLSSSVEVIATEEAEPNMELIITPYKPDIPPIYIDKDIEADITTGYLTRKVNIEFKYWSSSKSDIESKVNLLRTMTSNDGHTWLHDIEYYYNTGDFVIRLLDEINKLKNKRLKQPISLVEYLAKHFDNRADLTYTDDGDLNKAELVIRERILEVAGYIESDTYNVNPEYDDNKSQWSVSLTYTFSYDKPIMLFVKYPLIVYNSVINKKFRLFNKYQKKRMNPNYTGRMDGIERSLKKFDPLMPFRNNQYLLIPKDDTFRVPILSDSIARLFSVLIIVDEQDKTLLFNIDDITSVRFTKRIREFLMESERDYIGDVYQSLFYVELWENSERAYKYVVLLDKDGNFRTNKPMDMTKTYRVVFNIITNINILDMKSELRIIEFVEKQKKLVNEELNKKDPLKDMNLPLPKTKEEISEEKKKEGMLKLEQSSNRIDGVLHPNTDMEIYGVQESDTVDTLYVKLLDMDIGEYRSNGLGVADENLFIKLKTNKYHKFKTKAIYSTICLRNILESKE